MLTARARSRRPLCVMVRFAEARRVAPQTKLASVRAASKELERLLDRPIGSNRCKGGTPSPAVSVCSISRAFAPRVSNSSAAMSGRLTEDKGVALCLINPRPLGLSLISRRMSPASLSFAALGLRRVWDQPAARGVIRFSESVSRCVGSVRVACVVSVGCG